MSKIRHFSIFGFIILLFSQFLSAGERIETNYMRPSVSYMFIDGNRQIERTLLSAINELEIENQFNDHRIDFPVIRNYPQLPQRPQDAALYSQYRQELEAAQSKRRKVLRSNINDFSREIVAKWFNRDNEGKLNTDLIGKRGIFTATDADAREAMAASVDRREMLGELLIDKTYIIVWEITELMTMSEYYRSRETDRSNRTDEGYRVRYSASLYKLDWNDSVQAVFYQDYWVDDNNFDRAKVEAFNNAVFPTKHITTVTGRASSTQPIDKSDSYYRFNRQKTMDELLRDLAVPMQSDAGFQFARSVPDFRVKAPVYSTRPLGSKMGTKEGLYFDQRFFIYEIELDASGNQKTNRKGVARVRNIVDNDTIAIGDSEPSTFRQVGGSRIYTGMLMESKRDFGIIISGGYISVPENQALAGVDLGLDIRISGALHRSSNISISGLHMGVGLTVNAFNDIDIAAPFEVGNIAAGTNTSASGLTLNAFVSISKETYFTRRGNLYLNPLAGMGLSVYSFNSIGDFDLETDTPENDLYTWNALSFPLSLGIGLHISPAISLEFKPGVIITSSYRNNSDNLVMNIKSDENWGFDALQGGTFSSSVFHLRIRI